MKILLLNSPPLRRFGIVGQIYPPLGVLYLAAYVREKYGLADIRVIDGYHENGIPAVIEKIDSFSPDILGVSFTTQAATGAYAIINEIKAKKSGIFIVTGGPHPTLCANEVLTRSRADAVVMGEGEETFLELVARIARVPAFPLTPGTSLGAQRDWQDIRGIAYNREGMVIVNGPRPLIADLDTIPFPARDLLPIKNYPGYHYKKTAWDTSYISGRGCPYQCVYCSNPVWKFQKPWFRVRSPKNIADEIACLKKTYGVREFYDQTDLFNGSISWAKQVCDEFVSRKLDIFWKVQMTVQNIDDELARKMVRSGCWLGLLGIESGNDATSRGINKRSDRDTAERALTTLKRNGMKTFGLFMAFNVWEENGRLMYEDRKATEHTLDFARELIKKRALDIMSWSLTTPYPGSRLYIIAKAHKLIPGDLDGKWEFWDSSENFIMKIPGVTQKDWESIKRRGKLLQVYLLFRSGTFNMHSIPIYVKKGMSLLRRMRSKQQ